VPRRHVADFFEMSAAEQAAVLELLNTAQRMVRAQHAPDGFNIGVNLGKAAGQSRRGRRALRAEALALFQ